MSGGVSENRLEFYCGGWVEGARGVWGGLPSTSASATTHRYAAFGERSRVVGLIERFFCATSLDGDGQGFFRSVNVNRLVRDGLAHPLIQRHPERILHPPTTTGFAFTRV